jgi:carboxymethylproline synthase
MQVEITNTGSSQYGIIEFNWHKHNPFSISKMIQLVKIIEGFKRNSKLRAVAFYGGDGNSFSVGGDFNETSLFSSNADVVEWIDAVYNVYRSILETNVTFVSAINGFSIGFGLQLALCCDYRIASKEAKFSMPEFKLGIACNFGGFLLEKIAGRNLMQKMLFDCEIIDSNYALKKQLIHKVLSQDSLTIELRNFLEKICNYPEGPIQQTKKYLNKNILHELKNISDQAKIAHSNCFEKGIAQKNMRKIITR